METPAGPARRPERPARADGGRYVFVQFLCYFLTLLIPTAATGLVGYVYTRNARMKSLAESLDHDLRLAAGQLDASILQIQQLCSSVLLDNTVKLAFAQPGDTDTYYEWLKLPSVIARYTSISAVPLDGFFLFVDEDDVLTGRSIEEFGLFFGAFYHMEGYEASDWAAMLDAPYSVRVGLPVVRTRKSIAGEATVVPLITISNVNGRKAVICATLLFPTILSTIRSGIHDGDTRLVITTDQGDAVYADRAGDILAVQSGGGDALISSASSAMLDWTFQALTPFSVFERQAWPFLQLSLIQLSAALALGSALALYYARRLYSPIASVRRAMNLQSEASGSGPLRSYEDTMRRIAAQHERQRDQNEALSERNQELLLSRLIFSRNTWDAERRLYLQLLRESAGDPMPWHLCVVVQPVLTAVCQAELGEAGCERLMDKVRETVASVFAERMQCHALSQAEGSFMLVLGMIEADTGTLTATVSEVESIWRPHERKFRLRLGIGGAKEGLEALRDSYDEAMTALYYRPPLESDPFVTVCHGVRVPRTEGAALGWDDEIKLVEFLRQGDMEQLGAALTRLIRRGEAQRVSYLALAQRIDALRHIGERYSIVRYGAVPPADRIGPDVSLHPLSLSVDECAERLLRFYREILALSRRPENQSPPSASEAMKAYIHEAYQGELSVGQVADHANISIGHASRVFKRETGLSIAEYINAVRMEKACELLATTQMKLEDVAERVGIFSRSTFMRAFRAEYGVTPGTYRTRANTGSAAVPPSVMDDKK